MASTSYDVSALGVATDHESLPYEPRAPQAF